MSNFETYVLSVLCSGIFRAVIMAALAFIVGLAVCRRTGRKISIGNAILDLLLIGYITVLVSSTAQRYTSGGSGLNFHLFRALREAWTQATQTAVLNPILNTLMFVPLGILLPLRWKRFVRFKSILLAAFGATLLIEFAELANDTGAFDVDDLACNTLGTLVGFGLYKTVSAIRNKRPRELAWIALPVLTAGFTAVVFLAYQLQPYGNLREEPSYRISTSGVEWELACSLSADETDASVYRLVLRTDEESLAYGEEFFKTAGLEYDTFSTYDENYWFERHQTPYTLLKVSRQSGGCYFTRSIKDGLKAAVLEEDALRAVLEQYGINVPEGAALTQEAEEDGTVTQIFTADSLQTDDGIFNGEIRCQTAEDGTLFELDNQMAQYKYAAEAGLISQETAYKKLCRGDFRSEEFEDDDPEEITVLSCKLDYRLDTKGYYRPVWAFQLSYDEYIRTIVISAME